MVLQQEKKNQLYLKKTKKQKQITEEKKSLHVEFLFNRQQLTLKFTD